MRKVIITRFAPSPTGRLHLGHAWSALQAHDMARAAGGQFLLRIEDIDTGRCREEFVSGIEDDLRWLGLTWDGPILRQSERIAKYRAALDQLIEAGLAYRCWCTRTEIAALSASAPQGEAGPIYPGTCRPAQGASERDCANPGDGRSFCWRLDAERAGGSLSQGDVVIARKNMPTSYHLSVVIDDATQGVTDVVRGVDLKSALPVHRLLRHLLGLPEPRTHHHLLLGSADGERLAKRKLSPTISSLRGEGLDPVRLIDGMRGGRFPLGFALMPD
jgi:glutamyl-Q tRNA(Asp) synthetase